MSFYYIKPDGIISPPFDKIEKCQKAHLHDPDCFENLGSRQFRNKQTNEVVYWTQHLASVSYGVDHRSESRSDEHCAKLSAGARKAAATRKAMKLAKQA